MKPSHIVGIGASAGGLEALEQFFGSMPSDTGMAFVVIQHLSPDFKSLMDELLAHRTTMAIHRVEDGMSVEPNAVYLIPPRKEMIISDGRLLLTDKDPNQALTLPIDHFFRSLAQDVGRDAIAIVLSGTGSDGSRGIRQVHDTGGLVIVQSEESAKFDGMPRSAIDTGVADAVMHPAEMPAALLRYAQHPFAAAMLEDTEDKLSENKMGTLFKLLRDKHGIDFSHYKPSTVGRRIERRLLLQHASDLEEYVRRLSEDEQELNSLYKDLLIGVTKFFRDVEAFERLEQQILPELIAQKSAQEELRIWIPGCGTGEEAYSLAILICERLAESNQKINVKIFATDVHRASIDHASAGIYSAESLSQISQDRLQRYFTRNGEQYQVISDLRQMIVFAHHNVLRDAPFTKLDLISCRNLLIYFQPQSQKKTVSFFHFALRTGGILFLGPSESPAELSDEFETIDSRWKIYRKRRDVRLPADLRLPLSSTTGFLNSSSLATPPAKSQRGWDNRLYGSYDVILEDFMPPSFLVDEHRELMHIFGGAERYLSLSSGRTSTNIIDLVKSDLRLALSGTLTRVDKDKQTTELGGVRIDDDQRVKILVKPIHNKLASTTHTLIVIEEEGQPGSAGADQESMAQMDLQQASRDRVDLLEKELRSTKENLQATVEELETSNEELQATNEELVASNEELQSTNEELHSVNEELYTVNAEYQRKINELTQLNTDMDNLLRSTEIGTIFLDRDLCIRKFTPQISRIFNLIPQDVGRRIDAFTNQIDEPQLVAKIENVLETETTFEREIHGQDGIWHYLRILPYRTSTNQVAGAVLTLIDISALKHAESAYEELDRQLRGILENSSSFIYVKDLNGHYTLCNRMSEELLGAPPERVYGKTDYEFLPTDTADIVQAHDLKVATSGKIQEFEETFSCGGDKRTYLSVKFPLRDDSDQIYGVGAVCTDITLREQATQTARQRVKRRDQFLAMLSHELRNPVGAIVNATRVMKHASDRFSIDETREVINRQSMHISRLLDDLLDVSRVTQGKIEMRRQVIDLQTTIDDAVSAVQPLINTHRQALHVDRPDGPIYLDADATRLQQVLVNLLSNASKYNDPQGNIWLQVRIEDNRVFVAVRDDGFGIPPEMQMDIFELFVQNEPDRSEGGLGVGLTLARSIIQKHGGRLSLHSNGHGKGSVFSFRLPLTSKRPAEIQQETPQLNGEEVRILVVEDNADARKTLEKLLELEGFKVTSAKDGGSALDSFAEQSFDIALIDIGLPDMTGYELAEKLQSRNLSQGVVLIALTGYGQDQDRQDALEAGFDEHLVKPLDMDRLINIITDYQAERA